MPGYTPLSDDPVFQPAWEELLRQVRAANAPDAPFWVALGDDVAAHDGAREALAEAWSEAQGDWPTALRCYRWWMQEHAELFPTVNAVAVELALAKREEKTANTSAIRRGKSPPTALH